MSLQFINGSKKSDSTTGVSELFFELFLCYRQIDYLNRDSDWTLMLLAFSFNVQTVEEQGHKNHGNLALNLENISSSNNPLCRLAQPLLS